MDRNVEHEWLGDWSIQVAEEKGRAAFSECRFVLEKLLLVAWKTSFPSLDVLGTMTFHSAVIIECSKQAPA
jgi:hypothetical protein